MVRFRIIFIILSFLFANEIYSQTFPRFRLIQLEQADTVGQFIISDTAKNAIWSSDLRVQDSTFYIFGNPYVVDSTRLNDTKDTLLYYQFGNIVGYSLIDGSPTNELQTLSISNDTIYLTNGGFVVLPSGFVDTDISGRNNTFVLIDSTIYITDDSATLSLDLRPLYDNTDTSGYNSQISLADSILTVTDGNSSFNIDFKQLYDNTDTSGYNNLLYFTNNVLFIADGKSELQVDLSSLATEDKVGYNKAFYITNDTLYITDDSTTQLVDLLPYLDNTDTSGFNRDLYVSNDTLYIQDDLTTLSVQLPIISPAFNRELYLQNDTLFLRDDSTTLFVKLNTFIDTDQQQLSKSNDTIYLTNSNYVVLNDDSPTNEIQFLSISNDTIFLTSGGFIKLPAETDNQNLSVQRSIDSTTISISIERGNTISFEDKVYDGDSSITNELQLLGLSNDTLYISNGNDVYLGNYTNTDTSGYNKILSFNNDTLYVTDGEGTLQVYIPVTIGADNQQLSKDLDTIFLERGGYVLLSDDNPTNELQILSLQNDTLFISNGNYVLLNAYINTDTSGYNTSMEYSNGVLKLRDGAGEVSALIPQLQDTDDQQLYIIQDTIFLTNSFPVVLSDNDPTNELQDLYLSTNKDTLYITNGSGVRLNIDSTRLNVTGDSLIYYYNDSIVRIDPLKTVIDVVSNCVSQITESTDVYALFDMSGSVNPNGVVAIAGVLNNWYSNYQTANPDYTGNLYIIPVAGAAPTERYLDYLRILRQNTLEVYTLVSEVNDIAILPPWLDTTVNGEFVAPNEMLLLAFVNETAPYYHETTDYFVTEPFSNYYTDFNNFVQQYDSMTFFKGIIYPIHQNLESNLDDGFILHALAALEGTTQTTQQIQDAFGNLYQPNIFDSLTVVNPYSTLGGLKNYGWSGVLDKSSPAINSFTDSSFNAELSEILNITDLQFVSVIQDYSNNILTLRSIGSNTLDVTVDEFGCIKVELKDTISTTIFTDTTTIIGNGTIVSPLQVAPALIQSIQNSIDSIEIVNTFEDSTRLDVTGDTLFYYQNGVIIGYGVISKGNGLFQEVFIGDGITDSIQITPYNGLLPKDKEDIFIFRNGLFIDEAYVVSLNTTTGILQLSFVPDLGDRIMIVWFRTEVNMTQEGIDTVVTDGITILGTGLTENKIRADTTVLATKTDLLIKLETVATDMYITGDGTVANPLSIDTMYTASKAYVDQQIIAAGTGDITAVNETPQYGIIGGANVGAVNLSVDTTVISAKTWVTSNFSQLDSIIGGYGMLGAGDIGNVTLIVDSNIIATKDYINSLNYITTNDSITLQGDIQTIKNTTLFDVTVNTASNIRGGVAGDLLYQSAVGTTSKLTLPPTIDVDKYVLSNAINSPYWRLTTDITAGRALRLDTARTINGVSFDGTANITIKANNTDTLFPGLHIVGNSYDGSTAQTWSINTSSTNVANTIVSRDESGNFGANLVVASLSGNATTATTLQTARLINGTSFNGSQDITTANWGTARNITIGNTTRSVNGSTNYSWTLSDIGAAATNQIFYIGTTQFTINRASATQTLTGINIDGQANRVANNLTPGNFMIGSAYNGSNAQTFNVDTTTIAHKDWVTANFTLPTISTLSAGYGLDGLSYNGSTNITWKTDTSIIAAKDWVTSNFTVGNQNISLIGDVTGTGTTNVNLTTTLATIAGLSAGTYNNVATQVRPFTIDTKGRITAIGTAVTITPAFSSITDKPTDLSGYGITDAYTITKVNDTLSYYQKTIVNNITGTGVANELTYFVNANQIGALPTTTYPNLNEISYVKGVTSSIQTQLNNKQAASSNLTSLAGLAYSSGTPIVRMVGTNLFSLDNTTYLTANQTITLSGDIQGSGSTSISTTLSNTGVVANTYRSVTVDAKGRVTAGTNPTTLSGYGITDALSNSTTSTQDGYFGDIYLRDDAVPSHYLKITNVDNLTANRTLSLLMNNADRTITMQGNLAVTAFANVSGTNTGDQTIELTGDVTGNGTGTFTTTLANTGVVANTYSYPTLTVDSKGRITSISSNTLLTQDSLSTPNTVVLRNPAAGINVNNLNANSLTVNGYSGVVGNQSTAVFYNGAINLVDANAAAFIGNPIINAVESTLLNDGVSSLTASASELFLTVANPDLFSDSLNFVGRYTPIFTMRGLNFTRRTNEKGLIKLTAGGNPAGTFNGHDGAIVFATKEIDRLAITPDGRVGIGTIPNNTGTALNSDITHLLQVKTSTNEVNLLRLVAGSSIEAFNVKTTSNGNFVNVGIHEANPLAHLHIGGGASANISGLSTSLLITNNNGTGRIMFTASSAANIKYAIGTGYADATRFAIFTKNSASDFVGTDERLTIKSTGEVGINSTNPTYRFEVKDNTGTPITVTDGSIRPVARFLGDEDRGIHIGNNYIFNPHGYGTQNTTNNISIAFATKTSADANIKTRLVILGNGNVGIDTIAALEKLHVSGNIYASGTIIQNSDIKYKSNIRPIEPTYDKVKLLNVVRYIMNDKEDLGLIAQEVELIYPELVTTYENGNKALSYIKLVPLLIKALQEQEDRLSKLEELVNKILEDK